MGRSCVGLGVVEEFHPGGAVNFLQRERILDRVAEGSTNTYNFGGYLMWRLYPAHKVFIDGRIHLFYGQFFEDYMRLPNEPDLWPRTVKQL